MIEAFTERHDEFRAWTDRLRAAARALPELEVSDRLALVADLCRDLQRLLERPARALGLAADLHVAQVLLAGPRSSAELAHLRLQTVDTRDEVGAGHLRVRGAGGRLQPIEAADAVSDPAPAAVERVELAQQHQRLARCLGELDARHSTAIRAAFLDGATYEELAARMNVPLGTMKSWIRRGLLKLRACLER